MIHIFKDAALADPISEGDLSNPDDDILNGTDGESKDRQLYLANEQTTLAAPLGAVGNTVQLAQPRFQNGQVVIVDGETMGVVAGGGTTTLTVSRGFSGNVAHAAGTPIYVATKYNSLKVEPLDTEGTDEKSWIRLATSQAGLAAAVPGAALSLGTKNHNQTLTFWRRVTVPAATPIQNKTDLKLRVTGWENAV